MKQLLSSLRGIFFILIIAGLQACSSHAGPKPINYGVDQCAKSKINKKDARFGTQLITKKGRVYNFDDVQCMIAYVKEGQSKREEIAAFYLPDFQTQELMPAESMFYLKSEALKSPMRGDIAAFASKVDMESVLSEVGGTMLTWDDLWK